LEFLADHCLSEHVARALEDYGHQVTRLRDVIAPDAEDIVVAQTAINGGLILATHDDDFRAQQRNHTRRTRRAFDEVHLLLICDLGPNTVVRLAATIDLIEFEASAALAAERRLNMEVAAHRVTTHR